MRRKATIESLNKFMQEVAAAAQSPGRVYFTGGATALLLGFRDQTIDIDIKLDPEPKGIFEAIARLKNSLDLNVELAAPDDFIPARPDWREKSRLISSIGRVEFFHYDFALQALSKLERGHAQDLEDVESLLRAQCVSPAELRQVMSQIQPFLIRYPAIDPQAFSAKVGKYLADYEARQHAT
jgi:hypothetical protein